MSIFSSIKRQIPNCITLCNLLCGVLATYCASLQQLSAAAWWIVLGIFFDFFDGLFARLLKVPSEIGKELDSLADVVTSGVAPGIILFQILNTPSLPWLRYVALLTPALAAYRLAKFNLDDRQHHGAFLGLPAPANALIWVGLAFTTKIVPAEAWIFTTLGLVLLAVLSIVTALLMVTEMPMFSLKFNFKDLSWRTNRVRYHFLIECIVIIIGLGYAGWITFSLSVIILWYIILSLSTQNKED